LEIQRERSGYHRHLRVDLLPRTTPRFLVRSHSE
jgi:hypothetical protein